ncbi:MAG: hypothetical protein Q8P01_03395 [bacterium]|nr:hypothetical protein [bacterium]
MLAIHPDPTVDHILKTWAPRMIVQGIDYNNISARHRHERHGGTAAGYGRENSTQ